MAMVCIIMAGWNSLALGWTVANSFALWIYWVLRGKTTVGEKGIAIRYAFKGGKTISGTTSRKASASKAPRLC